LNKLSEKQRKRIELKFYNGLTFEEIAKAENCSKVAVHYSVQMALETLKKILESF
jgi:RNA polymerase sigma-70 factor (ECF subfamily)